MATVCPKCAEKHTDAFAVLLCDPNKGTEIVMPCRFCEHNTDTLYEFGIPITREEDRKDAEAEKNT